MRLLAKRRPPATLTPHQLVEELLHRQHRSVGFHRDVEPIVLMNTGSKNPLTSAS